MPTAFTVATTQPARPRQPQRRSRRYSRHAPALLAFFSQHRTALSAHVQRSFPDFLPSDRTCRLHLQTLVAAGDLTVVRCDGVGRPNVYSITAAGLRRAGELTGDDQPASRRRPTGSHQLHELLITELAVSLTETVRNRPDVTIPWQARVNLANHPAFSHVVPDYAFLFRHDAGQLVCLVEVSSGEESATRLGDKLSRYATWSDSPAATDFLLDLYRRHGAEHPRPAFRLVFVVQNRRTGIDATRLRQLFLQAMQQPEQLRDRLWATTVADLAAANDLDQPVWVCGRDLDIALAAWHRSNRRKQRSLIRAAIEQAPRRRLFPPHVTGDQTTAGHAG